MSARTIYNVFSLAHSTEFFSIMCNLPYTVDPPNTAALGTGEITAVLENGCKGSHIKPRKNIFGT